MRDYDEFQKEMLEFINTTTEMQSLLYDLDRMPEQLKCGSKQWSEMLNIAQHIKLYGDRRAASSI